MEWIVRNIPLPKPIRANQAKCRNIGNHEVELSPNSQPLALVVLKMIVDQLRPAAENEVRMKNLIKIGLLLLKHGVLTIGALTRLLRPKSKDKRGTRRQCLWLPTAIIKINKNGFQERFVTIRGTLDQMNAIADSRSKDTLKTRRPKEELREMLSVIPQSLRAPVKGMIIKSAGWTTREAKARGISQPTLCVNKLNERLTDMESAKQEVDDLVHAYMHNSKLSKFDKAISKDVADFYKPLDHATAMNILRKLRKSILTNTEVADTCDAHSPYELHRRLSKLTAALDTMKLSNENQAVANQLRALCSSLPSYGDVVMDTMNTTLSNRLDAASLADLPTDPQQRMNVLQKVAAAYEKSMQEWAKRKKRKIWLIMQYKKSNRPNRIAKLIKAHPHLGAYIEWFVKNNDIGAGQWRRDDKLTITTQKGGKFKNLQKTTLEAIRQHLKKKHNVKISRSYIHYSGPVKNSSVQRDSGRYKGRTRVVFRKARRGFDNKFSGDRYLSKSQYEIKDLVELFRPNPNVKVLNRDDAAVFRADTVETHAKHRTMCLAGNEVLRGRTDFKMAPCPTDLQVTSYLFPKTATSPQCPIAVVKAKAICPKSAVQHYCDLEEVRKLPVARNIFQPGKFEIMVHRRDGATDEGPYYKQVQFWATFEHLTFGQLATVVTARWAGGSYLNDVERMNGALKMAENHLFLTSTAYGRHDDWETKEGRKKLNSNMNAMAQFYAHFMQGSTYGGKSIEFLVGQEGRLVKLQDDLKAFLKASEETRADELRKGSKSFAFFKKITDLQKRHRISTSTGMSKYFFGLSCCYKPGCEHPICKDPSLHHEAQQQEWAQGIGVDTTFYPAKDPKFVWGAANCERCHKEKCRGHYLPATDALEANASNSPLLCKRTPTEIIKAKVDSIHQLSGRTYLRDIEARDLGRKCLLTTTEVEYVAKHLFYLKRKLGAKRQREAEKEALTAGMRSGTKICASCNAAVRGRQANTTCFKCKSLYHKKCAAQDGFLDEFNICDCCVQSYEPIQFEQGPDRYTE